MYNTLFLLMHPSVCSTNAAVQVYICLSPNYSLSCVWQVAQNLYYPCPRKTVVLQCAEVDIHSTTSGDQPVLSVVGKERECVSFENFQSLKVYIIPGYLAYIDC